MFWPAFVFNLCVGLLLAAYLLRAVRRFERRADTVMAKLDRWHAEELQKFEVASGEIRASMQEQIDSALSDLQEMVDRWRDSDADVKARIALAEAERVLRESESLHPSRGIREEDVVRLPRRARVAFEARCARWVLPLVYRFRNDNTAEASALTTAVQSSEALASGVIPAVPTGVIESARQAAQSIFPKPNHSEPNDPMRAAALDAAYAVFKMAEAANDPHEPPIEGFRAAVRAANAVGPQLATFLRDDFDTIRALVAANNWTDDTPVAPSVFGTLPEQSTVERAVNSAVPSEAK